MRDFHMTEEQALEYPLNRAFALMNFTAESNPWGRVVYESDGYIAQEINKQGRAVLPRRPD